MKNIIICGNYGAGNLGDDAILQGLIKLVNSTFRKVSISVLSGNPSAISDKQISKSYFLFPSGFKSIFLFWLTGRFISTIRAVWSADFIILGGGGLFAGDQKRACFIWFTQFLWFWILRKDVACLAQSVGPIDSKFQKLVTKFVFKRARLITVRDDSSRKILSEMGIKNVYLNTDAAFALAYQSQPAINRSNRIVINLRQWSAKDDQAFTCLSEIIDQLYQTDKTKFIFIPWQLDESDDQNGFELLKNKITAKNALEYRKFTDIQELLEYLSRSKALIGMRLHSNIFAILTDTPFVALSYSDKVIDFCRNLGLDDMCLKYPKEINTDKLFQLLKEIDTENNGLKKRISTVKIQQTYKFYDHTHLLKDTFGE